MHETGSSTELPAWDLTLRRSGHPIMMAFETEMASLYEKADWHGAFRVAERFAGKYPRMVSLQVIRAALLGDWAEEFTGAERAKRKAAALRTLRAWVRTPPLKLPQALKGFAENELYYHAGQWKRQALLGAWSVRQGNRRSFYSLGVGSACHAAELIRRGQFVASQRWAERALGAWQTYFREQSAERFDTHCFHAIALATLGRFEDAEEALRRVRSLIGRDIRSTSIYDVEARLAWCMHVRRG